MRLASFEAIVRALEEPFPFDAEYSQALLKPLYGSVEVRFVTLATLLDMKQAAGRDQDKIDIANLRLRLDEDAGP